MFGFTSKAPGTVATINAQPVRVQQGETILSAALREGVDFPHSWPRGRLRQLQVQAGGGPGARVHRIQLPAVGRGAGPAHHPGLPERALGASAYRGGTDPGAGGSGGSGYRGGAGGADARHPALAAAARYPVALQARTVCAAVAGLAAGPDPQLFVCQPARCAGRGGVLRAPGAGRCIHRPCAR